MRAYQKIHTIYKHDEETHKVIVGDYSLPEFQYLQNNTWDYTEKVDGTNIRVGWNGTCLEYGGRTDNAQMPVKILNKLHELFEPKIELLGEMFGDEQIVFYGEGYGAGIQKGGGNYISKDVDFVLFDILIGNWWLERPNVEDVASKIGICVVPMVGAGSLIGAVSMAARGFASQWGDFQAEGLVLRPAVTLMRRNGERILAKIKHKDF